MSFPIGLNKLQNLCILRLSAIGDVTHVLPIIASIQHQAPQLRITWVVGKIEYKLLKGLKGVDFVIFDKNKGFLAYKKLKSELKKIKFDVLLQMQYSFRANLAAQMISAKYRVGFDKKRSRELHSFRLTHRIEAVEKQHVLDGFFGFAKIIGVSELVKKWPLTFSREDEEKAISWLKKGQKNVIISPCSSHPLRNWSSDKYAKIADVLISKYKVNVLLCGGPSEYEKKISKEIEGLCKYELSNITGQDTLKQLFVTMKNSDLVISPDSGPAHIANAAGVPVIVLHGATTAKRSGAYLNQHLAVDVFSQAAEKIAEKNPESIRWGGQLTLPGVMDLITVEQVEEKISQVFYE